MIRASGLQRYRDGRARGPRGCIGRADGRAAGVPVRPGAGEGPGAGAAGAG